MRSPRVAWSAIAIRYRQSKHPVMVHEARIAAIWADELGRDRVDADEGFLALGGNSLIAMRIVAKVEQELDVELSMRVLWEGGTVAGMVEHVRASLATGRREYGS